MSIGSCQNNLVGLGVQVGKGRPLLTPSLTPMMWIRAPIPTSSVLKGFHTPIRGRRGRDRMVV
jgi:hypothetical protein